MRAPLGLSVGIAATIITVAIANLGNNIIAPVMPALRDYFGSTMAEVGLVASAFGLGRLIMDLPAGYLTERLSPTKMFAIGIVLAGGAAALAATAGTLQQVILFRGLMGFGSSIMTTVALVLLVGIARPDQRGSVLALYTSAMLFGQAISPSIGGYLATLFDWRAAFVFCALTPFVSFPLNLIATSKAAARRRSALTELQTLSTESLQEASRHPRSPRGLRATGRTNWPALVTVYFGTFANFFNRHGMRQALLPLYGGLVLRLDPGTIGAILTTGSIFTIIVTLPGGAAADRIGKKLLLVPGMMTLVLGNMALFAGQGQMIFIVATVLVSMAVLANSMLSGLTADLIPERLVGRGMGLYRFTADLGVVLGPFTLGLAVDRFGFGAGLILGASVVLLSIAAILALVPRRTTPLPVPPTA